jgi:hypothetical protein
LDGIKLLVGKACSCVFEIMLYLIVRPDNLERRRKEERGDQKKDQVTVPLVVRERGSYETVIFDLQHGRGLRL